jgi:hypothetical protein
MPEDGHVLTRNPKMGGQRVKIEVVELVLDRGSERHPLNEYH